jgi:hypothetical protein
MANTTNYNWETPDNTDLVKDGALAIRTLGSSIDTTTKALNPSTTLGDIEYRSSTANTNTRLGIGTTGQVLTVSGGVPSWATPAGGGFVGVQATKTADQNCASGTNVEIAFDTEAFDTDGFHIITSGNTQRLTVPTGLGGYYKVYFAAQWANSSNAGRRIVSVYKNGDANTGTFLNTFETGSIGFPSCAMSFTVNLIAGDWIQLDAIQTTSGTLAFRAANAIFGMEKIG